MSDGKPSPNAAFNALSDGHKAFVTHYLDHFNASRAAREAGYSENSAASQASELLRNPNIVAAVSEQLDRLGITAERIKCGYAEIAFDGDIADAEEFLTCGAKLKDLRKDGKLNTRLIQSVTITRADGEKSSSETRKISTYDRLRALDGLAKVKAMFVERSQVEMSGTVEVTNGVDPTELCDLAAAAMSARPGREPQVAPVDADGGEGQQEPPAPVD